MGDMNIYSVREDEKKLHPSTKNIQREVYDKELEENLLSAIDEKSLTVKKRNFAADKNTAVKDYNSMLSNISMIGQETSIERQVGGLFANNKLNVTSLETKNARQRVVSDRTILLAQTKEASHHFAKTRRRAISASADKMASVKKKADKLRDSLSGMSSYKKRIKALTGLFSDINNASKSYAEGISSTEEEEKHMKLQSDMIFYQRVYNVYQQERILLSQEENKEGDIASIDEAMREIRDKIMDTVALMSTMGNISQDWEYAMNENIIPLEKNTRTIEHTGDSQAIEENTHEERFNTVTKIRFNKSVSRYNDDEKMKERAAFANYEERSYESNDLLEEDEAVVDINEMKNDSYVNTIMVSLKEKKEEEEKAKSEEQEQPKEQLQEDKRIFKTDAPEQDLIIEDDEIQRKTESIQNNIISGYYEGVQVLLKAKILGSNPEISEENKNVLKDRSIVFNEKTLLFLNLNKSFIKYWKNEKDLVNLFDNLKLNGEINELYENSKDSIQKLMNDKAFLVEFLTEFQEAFKVLNIDQNEMKKAMLTDLKTMLYVFSGDTKFSKFESDKKKEGSIRDKQNSYLDYFEELEQAELQRQEEEKRRIEEEKKNKQNANNA